MYRWADADSPWQLLATCADIAAALRSGDPETYESKIPIHQDGSCNGLQHYAALGRDECGGSAVNLTNKDRPQVPSPPPLPPSPGGGNVVFLVDVRLCSSGASQLA